MTNYLNTYRRYACDLTRINEEAKHNAEDFVLTTEKIFRHDLRLVAEQVANMHTKRHVMLLSGPSSSGKTTTAKKLADEFRQKGINVQMISMDDFYLGMKYIRTLPNGKPDFEAVDALDIPMIKDCIQKLTTIGEYEIPKYDFKNSQRTHMTKHISVEENSVIIMEGIHALNPIFSEGMPKELVSKLYVAVKQGIKNDEDYVLTNREIRFIRRLVRDYQFRKVEPKHMVSMWPLVVEGEKKYIRPYRYTGDFTVNSIHIYEPCIMKELALDLLYKIEEDAEERVFAEHLIHSLEKFESIDPSLIPKNSLIREFIGGGCYDY